jgi:cytidylate kinase
MDEGFHLSTQIAAAQFDAIRALAEEGNCIFVGRCADYVLRRRQDLLRVFIMAPTEFRVRTMMARRELSEEQAKKLVRQVDKDRSSYYKYYTDQIWGEIDNYDLCINSARTGVEGAIKAIAGVVRSLKQA